MGDEAFDYIIVGAGSAGCVLADRLSEDGRSTVLVLEYGGSDRSIFIQMPAALSIPMNSKTYNWGYVSEPEPNLNGRRISCPRGKVLGGSSSINGLVYVRGHPLDFDRWEEEGAKGWGYRNVLPYFRRAESFGGGADAWRGGEGPLATAPGRRRNPLYAAFIEAGRQAGYAVSSDLNGERQEGFGALDMTVRDGVRASAANAYLRPAMKRPNLKVVTHALATRIAFDGRRAAGVHYRRGGREHKASARREVILCGGPINSPQLLKLSGVGPAAELGAFGIDVVADRPGVGENLQDHLEFTFQVASKQPITLYRHTGLIGRARIGAAVAPARQGPRRLQSFRGGRLHPLARRRSLSRHPVPLPADCGRLRRLDARPRARLSGPCRADAVEEPRLGAPEVARSGRAAADPVQLHEPSRRLDRDARLRAPDPRDFRSTRLRSLSRAARSSPALIASSDEAIDAFVRERVESAYHPSCACKMGSPADPSAVVDPETRVIGVEA